MKTAAGLEPVDALDVLDGLLLADLESRSEQQLADDLRTLQVLRNRLDGEFLRRLGAFDARGGAGAEHALSTQAWLRQHCHVSHTTAHGRVAIARRLRTESPLQWAVAKGTISYEHAVVVNRALDKLPTSAVSAAEAILVSTATAIDPGRLKHVADTIREAVAPELLAEDTQAAFARRYLNASETLDGMVAVDGLLDPESGAIVLAAVHALATPAGPDDLRSAGQRRADALTEAVRAGLDAGALPETGGERPHLTLTIDIAPFLDGGVPVAHTPTGARIAGETVRRILCDASISRVVMHGPSEVLDVGRRTRIVPSGMRRALAVRDGGCAGHGCDRPPLWTDAHHVVPWSQGGTTSVDTLVLLCRRHHILVHEGGWVCVRDGTGWVVVPPSMVTHHPPAVNQ